LNVNPRPENPAPPPESAFPHRPPPSFPPLKALKKFGNSISFTLQKLKMPDIEDSVSHREILPREIPKNEILGITMSLTVS
jgi:hypothetical protein